MNKERLLSVLKDSNIRSLYIYNSYSNIIGKDCPKILARKIQKRNRKEYKDNGNPSILLDTYDGSGQVVHPDIVYWHDEYWMVVTPYPYTNERYENPCIFHGVSLFAMNNITANPLALPEFNQLRNHISDPCLYVKNDTLNVVFRDTINNSTDINRQKIYLCSSADGQSWTEKKLLFDSSEDSFISPAIIVDHKTIFFFFVKLQSENGGNIIRWELDERFDCLSKTEVCVNNIPEDRIIWHFGLMTGSSSGKLNDNGIIKAAITLRQISDPAKYFLYWGSSVYPYTTWTLEKEIAIPQYLTEQIDIVYKCSIIPRTNDLMLSFRDKSMRWRLYVIPGLNDLTSEKSIIDSYRVFSRVFQSPMSLEKFIYKHENNPYRLPCYYYQSLEGEKVIGTNCFLGAKVKYKDIVFNSVQSCDTAVVPENRGGGVFMRMISEASNVLKDNDVDFMFGFPNGKSYGGFIKLGWKDIGAYYTYVRISKPLVYIKDGIKRKAHIAVGKLKHDKEWIRAQMKKIKQDCGSVGLNVDCEWECPFTEVDIDIINSTNKLKILRNYEYFIWKIDKNIDMYTYVTIRKEEKLIGYVICYLDNIGRLKVLDWFVSDNYDLTKGYDVFALILKLLENMASIIIFPMVLKGSSEETALIHDKYFLGKMWHFQFDPLKMIVNPLKMDEEYQNIIQNVQNWFITAIDLDTTIS